MPGDTVLVLFGGSGSELEVCKVNERKYISAEIDEKYHRMILDRLSNGFIKEKYKLDLRHQRQNNSIAQLSLLSENQNAHRT
jgi:DNA modification methylase